MSAYNIANAYRALRKGDLDEAAAQLRVFYPAPQREARLTEDDIAVYIDERYIAEKTLDAVYPERRGALPIYSKRS